MLPSPPFQEPEKSVEKKLQNFSKFPGRFGEVRLGHVLLFFEGELNNKMSPMVGSLVVNVNFLRICFHEKGTSTWG